jgi:hypothetical protein
VSTPRIEVFSSRTGGHRPSEGDDSGLKCTHAALLIQSTPRIEVFPPHTGIHRPSEGDESGLSAPNTRSPSDCPQPPALEAELGPRQALRAWGSIGSPEPKLNHSQRPKMIAQAAPSIKRNFHMLAVYSRLQPLGDPRLPKDHQMQRGP